MLPGAALALAAAVAVALPAGGERLRPRLQVEMQVEPGANLRPVDVREVATDVQRIWDGVVDVSVSTPEEAHRLIAVDTIQLTVTTRTLPGSDSTGLGWIEFVNGEPQPAITVSIAAARQLLAAGTWRGRPFSSLPTQVSRVFLGRTLARAIAHEIGHYLLRSKTHDRQGLMRPVFSVDEMMDGRASLVRLSAAEVARLRDQRSLVARVSGP